MSGGLFAEDGWWHEQRRRETVCLALNGLSRRRFGARRADLVAPAELRVTVRRSAVKPPVPEFVCDREPSAAGAATRFYRVHPYALLGRHEQARQRRARR